MEIIASEMRAKTRETFKNQWGKAIVMPFLPNIYYWAFVIVIVIVAMLIGITIGIAGGRDIVIYDTTYILSTFGRIIGMLALSFLLLGVGFKFIDWDQNSELDFSAPKAGFNVFNYSIWMIIKISVIEAFFVFLWSLLLVIPGIIKSFSYAQALNLYKTAVDDGTADQYKAVDYISQSKELMDGYKFDFLYLQLSFIGWILLGGLTLGIGGLWLTPYMMGSQAAFFNKLREIKENKRYEEES